MNDIWTDGEGRPVPEPAESQHAPRWLGVLLLAAVAGIGLGICLSILARVMS